MLTSQCILCGRNDNETCFSLEHVIPASIRGKLLLSDRVCKSCNSKLGHTVDIEILKHPGIMEAMGSLGLKTQYDTNLKHHFRTELTTEDSVIFKAQANGKRTTLLPQDNVKFKRVYPATEDGKRGLHTLLLKEASKKKIDPESTRDEINRVIYWIDADEHLESTMHSEPFKCDFHKHTIKMASIKTPKTPAKLSAFVAKIAYEFMHIIGGGPFVQDSEIAKGLRKTICSLEDTGGIATGSMKAPFDTPQPFHSIRCYHFHGAVKVDIVLFGSVAFTMVSAIHLAEDFFAFIEQDFDIPDIIGIQYEQDVLENGYTLLALGPNDKVKSLL